MTTERFQEIVLGMAALLWGVLLAIPNGDGPPRFAALIRFLPDYAWGALLIVCGATLLAVLPIRLRKEAHAATGIVWVLVVALILMRSVSISAALLVTPFMVMALLHFYRYLQLSQLAKL